MVLEPLQYKGIIEKMHGLFGEFREGRANMSKPTPRILCLRAMFALLLSLSLHACAFAEDRGYRVLMINSYHSTYPWTVEVVEGVRQTLLSSGSELEFMVEYMDTKHGASSWHSGPFSRYISKKYSSRRIDLIICSDDDALRFIRIVRGKHFPGVPVVFCGLNNMELFERVALPQLTGVFEELDVRGTAELALGLFPRTLNLALVSDNSSTGMAVARQARKDLADLRERVKIIELNGLSEAELQDRLSALPSSTVVLMLLYFQDGRGNYISPSRSSALVKSSCSYPMFSLWRMMPEEGAFGGSVMQSRLHGEKAGEIALRVLMGEPAAEIPVQTDRDYVTVFNHEELLRFGISRNDLPLDSIIVNEPRSVYSFNWRLVVFNASLVLACAVYVSVLLFNERRRKRAARSLALRKMMWEGLFGNAPEAFVVIDETSTVLNINAAFTRLFGYTPAEASGRNIDDLVAAGTDVMSEAVEITDRLQRGETIHVEGVRRSKDGKPLHISVYGSLFTLPEGAVFGYVIYTDISGRLRDEQEMERYIISEATVAAVSRTLLSGSSLTGIPRSMEEMAALVGADEGFFVEFSPDGFIDRELLLSEDRTSWSVSPHVADILLKADVEAIDRHLADNGRLLLDERAEFARRNAVRARELNRVFGTPLLILPIRSDSLTVGWVALRVPQYPLPPSIDSTLEVFCDLLGSVLQQERGRARATEHAAILEGTSRELVEILGRTLAMKDPYTVGHQYEVARLARAMAKRGGFDEAFVERVYYASLVHDLGKIVIPSSILSKPGRLNDVEFEIIKGHALHGWEILSSTDFPWPLAEIVVQHHERLDGSGYPHGLKGTEIMTEARILMVADVVEAMASHRPYRPGLGIEAALEEVRSGSGILFDPLAVELCLVVMEGGFVFDEKNYELSLP